MKNYSIEIFEDYHDIKDVDSKFNAIELGCFPVKNKPYCYYYALIYKKGIRKPKFNTIAPKIIKLLDLSPNVLGATTWEEVKQTVKESLNENTSH